MEYNVSDWSGVFLCCRMLKFPGMRPTAEVVGILNKSVRRQQVVGILKQEHAGDVLTLIASDPRMPHMMVNAASMPFELRQKLQVLPTSDITADAWLNAAHVFVVVVFKCGLCLLSQPMCDLYCGAAGKLQ